MASRDGAGRPATKGRTVAQSLGQRIEPWVKRRTPAEKAVLLVVVFALLGLYSFFELRDLWQWVF